MVQMFSHCVLGSVDDMDLDELLATKLVTFMMEHHSTIFQAPSKLHRQVEEHLSHLKRVQVSVHTHTQHRYNSLGPVFISHLLTPTLHKNEISVKMMCQIGSIILPTLVWK